MAKTYVEINLKGIELVRYSYDSDRRNPSFEWAHIPSKKKFKYKPKVVNGEPIEVPGVRNLIRFELTDN